MERPTLRQLEYLVALAEHLHFRKAAEACSVSQPALSGQIQQLEASLGLALFERDHRRVLATAAGRELAARARAVLDDVDTLLEVAHGLARPLCGPLRLGVIPTIAPFLLPRLIPAVRRRFPDLELILREETTEELIRGMDAGRLDLLLLDIGEELPHLHARELFEDRFHLAAPAGHPLLARPRVAQDELHRHPLLLLDEGHCLRHRALELCEKTGASTREEVRATSLVTLAQMCAQGLGVTLLPSIALPVLASTDSGLETRPFEEPAPSRRIGLAWRAGSPRTAEWGQLAAVFQEVLPRG